MSIQYLKKVIASGKNSFERFLYDFLTKKQESKTLNGILPALNETLGNIASIQKILKELGISKETKKIISQLSVRDIFLQMAMIDPHFMSLNGEKLSSDLPVGSLLTGGDLGPGIGSSWSEINPEKLLDPQNFNPETWRNYTEQYRKLALKKLTDNRIIFPFYGVDNVHGGIKTGGFILPCNALIGCIKSSEIKKVLEQEGKYVALMTKAGGANMVFAPDVDITSVVSQQKKSNKIWGRTEECFSADSKTAGKAGSSFVRGLQKQGVIAVAKHFVAEGYADQDQGTSSMTFKEIEAALNPFREAIKAGTTSIMLAYNSIRIIDTDGKLILPPIKCHNHKALIQYLRQKMGFKGILMSDWSGIDQIITKKGYITDENGKHKNFNPTISKKEDFKKVLEQGINEGDLDILMIPDRLNLYLESMQELYEEKKIPLEKIILSAARIIEAKLKYNLIREDKPQSKKESNLNDIKTFAKKIIGKGTVLLKGKTSDLTISPDTTIIMDGDADHMGRQCGGWTGNWQGVDKADIPVLNAQGSTYFKALDAKRPDKVFKMDQKIKSAKKTIGIYVLSEKPAGEWFGDIKPAELQISKEKIAKIKSLRSKVDKLILVVSNGRPLIIDDVLPEATAVLYLGRPGPQGGPALAEMLAGELKPQGTLNMPWPKK